MAGRNFSRAEVPGERAWSSWVSLTGTIRLIMLSAHLSTRPFIIPPPVYRYIDPLLTCVKLSRPLWALSSPGRSSFRVLSPLLSSLLISSFLCLSRERACLLLVSKGRSFARARHRVENNRASDRANDRGSLMNIVSTRVLRVGQNNDPFFEIDVCK